MVRLRRSDPSADGIVRRRRGKGFSYHWSHTGEKVDDPETLQRISDLAIPPAWQEVWICRWPNGHLQAVGTDDAGRRQYRYHDDWRRRRDAEKFDEMLSFARALPDLRRAVDAALANDGYGFERVVACAVRLLDLGFFRIGGEGARSGDTDTFGLTTMLKQHVRVDGEAVVFEYLAKGAKQRVQAFVDPAVRELVAGLRRRRSGGDQLLAYKNGRWVNLDARDVNEWLKQHTGGDYSAKDFRTWNATVLAAVALAVSGPVARSKTGRKRAEARAAREVGHYLGNTAAVARSSYIDPRVFDRYRSGWTISLAGLGGHVDLGEPSFQGPVEEAVLDLLERRTDSDAVEKVPRG